MKTTKTTFIAFVILYIIWSVLYLATGYFGILESLTVLSSISAFISLIVLETIKSYR